MDLLIKMYKLKKSTKIEKDDGSNTLIGGDVVIYESGHEGSNSYLRSSSSYH